MYVKEAFGIIYCVLKSLYYLQASPHVTIIETDHKPLTWLQNATSPLVLGWVVQHMWQFPWVVRYVKGRDNGLADGLSRPPVIAPGRLAPDGAAQAVTSLLTRIAIPPDCLRL